MSVRKQVQRRAPRILVSIPAVVEVLGHGEQALHPNLAAVYERVPASIEDVGEEFPAVIRDLSTNGAFLSGPPLALLSRVAFSFTLDGFGQCEVLGWTMWRRKASCEIPRDGQDPLTLKPGFGLLFESMPLPARVRLAELIKTRV